MSSIRNFTLRERGSRGTVKLSLRERAYPGETEPQRTLQIAYHNTVILEFYAKKGAVVICQADDSVERGIINRFFYLASLPYEIVNTRGILRIKNTHTNQLRNYESDFQIGLSGRQYRFLLDECSRTDRELLYLLNRTNTTY